MAVNNLERMLELVESVFAVRTDPEQLDVNEAVLKRLIELHPATVSELSNAEGPYLWILIIPTSEQTMHRFVRKEITESQLLNETRPGEKYSALYLCSALALPEYRGKGSARKLTLEAIERIRKDHPIQYLYVWPFTPEGNTLSEALSEITGLPLFRREG